MTHSQDKGVPTGQPPLVSRLMKGVYNCRQPQPWYSSTWDVDIVIEHIRCLGANSELSLKQLSQKLAVLMVLVEASQTSELGALDVCFRVFKPEGVLFRLATLTKKRSTGAPPKEVFFSAYPPDRRLCVVECLKQYEARTKQFRPEGKEQLENRLFLSHVRPHKPVTSQCIAHWIKDLLQEAGIDTKVSKHIQQECIYHSSV